MQKWRWAVRLLTRRVWFRAGLFCLFAALLALLGTVAAPFIPYEFGTKVGAKSVDSLLTLLASSMLAVTTFSLTAMVQAYSSATSSITPRAVQLLIDDTTSQNALSTFLGSFLFAVVGIIALSTGLYGESGRVILYAGSVFVIVVIVVTFLRWISHITSFGRVSDTIDRVERAAAEAARAIAQRPAFGQREDLAPPADGTPVYAAQAGRITHIDLTNLDEAANAADVDIHLSALTGAFVDAARPVAWVRGALAEKERCKIAAAFSVEHQRAFDHDPRFGLVVLGEIASRALSPAVNDPGTAIAVLEAGARVFAALLAARPEVTVPPRVHVPAIAFRDLLEDLYRPIARDGAGTVEVCIRLQKTLGGLQAIEPQAAGDCRACAEAALSRADAAIDDAGDRATLARVHARYWPDRDG